MMLVKNLTIYDIQQNKAYQYLNEDRGEINPIEGQFEIIKANSGYYLVTGEVKLNDGTLYPALFGISSDDGGEMFEYHFFTENGWIASKDDICKELKKTKTEIFPFKYHLNIKIEDDFHEDAQY